MFKNKLRESQALSDLVSPYDLYPKAELINYFVESVGDPDRWLTDSFNSSLVRLGVSNGAKRLVGALEFQFQYGTIGSMPCSL